MRTVLGALCAVVALAACGGSSSSTSSSDWKDLQSVRVTVAQPGLPPPFGLPKTKAFTTPAQVTKATALLNAHHIQRASSTTTSSGCAGGFQIGIVVVPRSAAPVRLSAYRCAGRTSGDVSGNLPAYLQALGFNVR